MTLDNINTSQAMQFTREAIIELDVELAALTAAIEEGADVARIDILEYRRKGFILLLGIAGPLESQETEEEALIVQANRDHRKATRDANIAARAVELEVVEVRAARAELALQQANNPPQ